MLSQYKNINQIISANKSIPAERFDRTKSEFFSFDAENSIYSNKEIIEGLDSSKVEMHVYAGDTWLTGNHKIQFQTKIPEFRDKITNKLININGAIGIDVYSEFNNLKLTAGKFKIAINFFNNLIGSYDRQHLRIDEISPDKF